MLPQHQISVIRLKRPGAHQTQRLCRAAFIALIASTRNFYSSRAVPCGATGAYARTSELLVYGVPRRDDETTGAAASTPPLDEFSQQRACTGLQLEPAVQTRTHARIASTARHGVDSRGGARRGARFWSVLLLHRRRRRRRSTAVAFCGMAPCRPNSCRSRGAFQCSESSETLLHATPSTEKSPTTGEIPFSR